jgi:hypothetical protein
MSFEISFTCPLFCSIGFDEIRPKVPLSSIIFWFCEILELLEGAYGPVISGESIADTGLAFPLTAQVL